MAEPKWLTSSFKGVELTVLLKPFIYESSENCELWAEVWFFNFFSRSAYRRITILSFQPHSTLPSRISDPL